MRKLLLLNVLLTGLLLGLILSVGLFSCSTSLPGGEPVSARDRDSLSHPELERLQSSFREVASIAAPSVVRIDVEEVRTQAPSRGNDTPWFDFFFGEPDQEDNGGDRRFRTQGLGSGVVVRRVDDIYYVLTNDHVVGNADAITITTDDGEEYSGEIVGKDARKDLALLSFVTSDDIPVALLGDSDSLRVGDWVLAIGSPFGFQSTVTAGIVSAVNRRGGPDGNISDFIQTDAAINRGNSGGALVNLRGEVIGINTWITSQTGGSMGLGFSIPVNNVKRSVDDFIETGSVRYGWLGVSIRSASPEVAESLNLPGRRGALVHHIFLDSPADRGGLLPGDFITEINGVRVQDYDHLVLKVGELPVGRIANFEVIRYGEQVSLSVRIAERESERQIAELNRRLWPGFSVFPITDQVRSDVGFDRDVRGVLVSTVESRTPAALSGLRVGDVVTEINGEATPRMLDFYRELHRAAGDITLTILRDGNLIEAGITR
ncbi:MAG: Do family serine endopeptidase [Spirochaetaceae bacterium]|nr:MAG: Do family serine endopeptidase [Spirochaetaceae bacterium]